MKAVLDAVISAALKSASGLAGIRLYLARKILEYGGQYIIDSIISWYSKLARKQKQEKAIDNLDKVDKDPKSTIDDKGKAYEDAFNSGR